MFFLLRGVTHLVVADELLLVFVEDRVFHGDALLEIRQGETWVAFSRQVVCAFQRLLQQLIEMVLFRHGDGLFVALFRRCSMSQLAFELAFLHIDAGLQKHFAVFFGDA